MAFKRLLRFKRRSRSAAERVPKTTAQVYREAITLLSSIDASNQDYQARCTDEAIDALKRALDACVSSGKPVKKGPDGARVNLGAGTDWSRPGWVAMDKFHRGDSEDVVVGDLLHRDLPRIFAAGSVEAIYSSHTFEHFTFTEALEILTDCYTVLKTGGAIRIVVPDLDIAVENLHFRNKDWWAKNEIQWHKDDYVPSDFDMSWNFLRTVGVQMTPKYYQRTLREVVRGYHYSAYNFDILREMFQKVGFRDITKSACGESRFPYFEGMDNRAVCSLYVEATK